MNPNKHVFLVDDDDKVRTSIEKMLERYHVVSFKSSLAFLADYTSGKFAEFRPACLLLDVFMPELNGPELKNRLQADFPSPVIFITGASVTPKMSRDLFKEHDGFDFLEKPFRKPELEEYVERALYLDAEIYAHEIQRKENLERYNNLSKREKEVFEQVILGRMNKEIAATLDISRRTVESHRTNITSKLQSNNIADWVVFGIDVGIREVGDDINSIIKSIEDAMRADEEDRDADNEPGSDRIGNGDFFQ